MDLLHTCYRSYMRLYPDDPDRLTLGRWVWCPAGADYLPFEHSFLSSKWDPSSWRVDPDIGEVRGIVGYSSGKITPRFTGRHFCGAVILYQEGSPLDLMGTPAVDADGVPLCCDAPPPVGGLAMGGEGISTDWSDILLWIRPEELDGMTEGDQIVAWPSMAPIIREALGVFGGQVSYHVDPLSGRGGALFPDGDPSMGIYGELRWSDMFLLDFTVYLVARTPLGVPYAMGLGGVPTTFGVALTVTDTFVAAAGNGSEGVVLYGNYAAPGTLHVWAARRKGDQWSVWRDGELLGAATGGTDAIFCNDFNAFWPLTTADNWWVPEIIVYPFAVTDDMNQSVTDYLTDKYGGDSDALELHVIDPLELTPAVDLILR